jgi:hypothetical protein
MGAPYTPPPEFTSGGSKTVTFFRKVLNMAADRVKAMTAHSKAQPFVSRQLAPDAATPVGTLPGQTGAAWNSEAITTAWKNIVDVAKNRLIEYGQQTSTGIGGSGGDPLSLLFSGAAGGGNSMMNYILTTPHIRDQLNVVLDQMVTGMFPGNANAKDDPLTYLYLSEYLSNLARGGGVSRNSSIPGIAVTGRSNFTATTGPYGGASFVSPQSNFLDALAQLANMRVLSIGSDIYLDYGFKGLGQDLASNSQAIDTARVVGAALDFTGDMIYSAAVLGANGAFLKVVKSDDKGLVKGALGLRKLGPLAILHLLDQVIAVYTGSSDINKPDIPTYLVGETSYLPNWVADQMINGTINDRTFSAAEQKLIQDNAPAASGFTAGNMRLDRYQGTGDQGRQGIVPTGNYGFPGESPMYAPNEAVTRNAYL